MRTPEEVTLALKEACKKIVSFEHNPKDADITDMAETLTPILMEILYNPVDRAHNLWGSQLCNPTTPNSTAPSSSSPPRKSYTTTALRETLQPLKSAKWKLNTHPRGLITRSTTHQTRGASNSSWTLSTRPWRRFNYSLNWLPTEVVSTIPTPSQFRCRWWSSMMHTKAYHNI